jgi:serine-type D-Ala-D-Ala carboxypeptidase (penicillin-binding protein 5/6)
VTGRLVLDAGQLEHTATVPPLQTTGDESQAGLEPGDHVSRDELLQGMLVASANDAARTLAVDVAGNERRFVRMMNAEAAAAGLDNTHYTNPTGLDDPAQHSSAADVAHLARDLMQNPAFRHIVAAESTTLNGSQLPTTNDLLGTYPGANGIKTGHTDQAGWCLAASRHPQRPHHHGHRPRRPHRTSPRRRRPHPPRLRLLRRLAVRVCTGQQGLCIPWLVQ